MDVFALLNSIHYAWWSAVVFVVCRKGKNTDNSIKTNTTNNKHDGRPQVRVNRIKQNKHIHEE
jgi:hypothetical protein